MTNELQRIGSKPITYNNSFPPIKRAFISQSQVKYVEDIIFTGDTANLGMSRREVIQKISDIGQAFYYAQADNKLDYFIREKRLPNMKSNGKSIKDQATNTELLHICAPQQ